jgi:hypothetical protein
LKTKLIEITVSPNGETTIETKGFSGSACRDASRAIESLLGQRTSEQLTSEFYQQAERQEHESA